MNVARKIVEENITSALVLEDDVDWDIRIRSQLRDFARASRLLVQPLSNTTDQMLDPTYPSLIPGQSPVDFEIDNCPATTEPTTSPYGDIDRWDILWTGHCGVRFPQLSDQNTPLGRVVLRDDETVPEPHHLDMQWGNDDLKREYPAHTRVMSRARVGTCTLAYGVSQPGARRLLYELALHRMTANTDLMFRAMCSGSEGRPVRTCLAVQPQLFQHHRPVGSKLAFSDISDHPDEMNEHAFTRNIRWSTRLNFPKLVDGRTDYVDLFKDGEKSPIDG